MPGRLALAVEPSHTQPTPDGTGHMAGQQAQPQTHQTQVRRDAPLGLSPFPPIADYAFLSDCATTALIAPSGNVEWMCLPRMDSGSLLDRDGGGFRLGPADVTVPVARRYLPGTMVLETSWGTPGGGWIIVRDVLLIGPWHHEGSRSKNYRRAPTDYDAEHVLLRTVRCVNGEVQIVLDCHPVFDYGRRTASWEYASDGYHEAKATTEGEDLTLRLTTDLQLGLEGPTWRTPSYHAGDGKSIQEASKKNGLEGVIAKKLDSSYEPGKRNNCWLKIKNVQRQEVVIGGWMPGEGRRAQSLGSLVVGYYDGDRLVYAGNVGTGFKEEDLVRLGRLLEPLKRKDSPFDGRQPKKGAIFVEPKLVAEVEFLEWTRTATLRAPSFKGPRDDKDPKAVVREVPEPPPG